MTSIDYLTFLGYSPGAIFSQAFAFLSAILNAEEIKLSLVPKQQVDRKTYGKHGTKESACLEPGQAMGKSPMELRWPHPMMLGTHCTHHN